MNILFLTDNFPPEVNAPASRTFEHCREWVKAGHKVTVITCFPNFPIGKVFSGYKNKLYQREVIEGINVIRVWSYITFNRGFLKRTIDYMSYAFSAAIASSFVKDIDVIVATSPQFFTALCGYVVSKIKRRPWVFELRDLWPESIRETGSSQNKLLINLLERLELALYKNANLIIALTQSFKQNLIERNIDAEKIFVVPNGVSQSFFYPVPKDNALLNNLKLNQKFVCGYIGTVGMAHRVIDIVHVAKKFSENGINDVHFFIVGDGAEKHNVERLVQDLQLSNITVTGLIPKNEIVRYFSVVDAVFVVLKDSPLFRTVIPSKIFEAAAMNKPIILGVDGEAREIVLKYGAGVAVGPENIQEMYDAVLRLKQDGIFYKTLQAGCRKLANAYSREVLAKEMVRIIEERLDSKRQ